MSAQPSPNPKHDEESLFARALELPASGRAAFFDAACHDDVGLRQRVQTLLAAHEKAGALFATQPEGVRSTVKLDLADEPADNAVGLIIGRYKLLEKMGERGCGVVYVAKQTESLRWLDYA